MMQSPEGFALSNPYPGVRLWRPDTDVLHNPTITPQEPGCDEVLLGLPVGECGGVVMTNRAIAAGSKLSPTGRIAGNHYPTHGADANAFLHAHGAQFGPPGDINPNESPLYFISAHGAPKSVSKEAKARGFEVYDTTCPLVTKTQVIIAKAAAIEGAKHIAYISFGKPDHPELVGAKGVAEEHALPFTIVSDEDSAVDLIKATEADTTIVVVGQTTNNSDAALALGAAIQQLAHAEGRGIKVTRERKSDVCHTVSDRQKSTQMIVAEGVGALVVVGSVKSKNTKSLADVAAREAHKLGQTLHIECVNSWSQLSELTGRIGVVSGASTMAANVYGVISRLNPVRGFKEIGKDTDRGIVFSPVDPATRALLQQNL